MRRWPALPALFAASAVVLAGCSDSSSESGAKSDPAPAATAPAAAAQPSAGCGKKAPKPGKVSLGKRSYLLALPEGYVPSKPAPVVVNLHGLGSNATQQALYSQLPIAGSRKGFIVVTPEHARGITGWRLPRMRDGESDIAFIGSLLDHVGKTLCADQGREFAAGMSNGAGLSAALVCGLKGRLAAVAPVAGVNLAEPCDGAKPTTIVAFHGTADKIVPYQGGEPYGDWTKVPAWMRPQGAKPDLPKVEGIVAAWAQGWGCRPATDSGGTVRLRRYAGCQGGAEVELHTVPDGGHTWPGAIDIKRLGKTTHLVDATQLMLDAFSKAPARR